jgi:hypothetical protein
MTGASSAITQKGEYHQQFPEMRKTHCLSTLSSNSVIGRSVATRQSSTLHEPGLPRLTATSNMFRYLLIISTLDCFVPRNDDFRKQHIFNHKGTKDTKGSQNFKELSQKGVSKQFTPFTIYCRGGKVVNFGLLRQPLKPLYNLALFVPFAVRLPANQRTYIFPRQTRQLHDSFRRQSVF